MRWILFLFIIILSSSTYAFSCYQESFDTNNQTGIDNCSSLNYNGFMERAHLNSLDGWFNITYIKPNNAIDASWHYKIGNQTRTDILPNECFNHEPNRLELRLEAIEFTYAQAFAYCLNDSGWQLLNSTFNSSNPGGCFGTQSYTMAFDGNYSSFAGYSGTSDAWNCDYHNNLAGNIYDEAIIWDIMPQQIGGIDSMNNLTINISDTLFFLAIITALFIVSVRIAYKSDGVWKALGMIGSSIFLGIFSISMMFYIHNNNVVSDITPLIVMSYLIMGVLSIASIIIFIYGMIFMFKKGDK